MHSTLKQYSLEGVCTVKKEKIRPICCDCGGTCYLTHGLLYIWTELLYLTCPHVADFLILIMSHKLTQYFLNFKVNPFLGIPKVRARTTDAQRGNSLHCKAKS